MGENIYTKCTRILVHGQGTCSQPHFMTSVVSRTSGVRHNSNYLISFQVVTCNLFPVTLHTLCGWRTMSECTLSNLCDRHSSIILWQFWFYGKQLAGRISTLQIRPYLAQIVHKYGKMFSRKTVRLGMAKKDRNKLLMSNAVQFCIPNSLWCAILVYQCASIQQHIKAN